MDRERYEICYENLRKREQKNIDLNRYWYTELRPVFAEMESIPYAIIKGEVLSIKSYGDVGFRSCGDIDFLIPREYVPKVVAIFKKNGFVENLYDSNGKPRKISRKEQIMFMNSHQIVPLVKNRGSLKEIPVDINVDIFWGEYTGKKIDINLFLEDTESITLYDSQIKILPDIKCFFEVCLHHYKEMQAPYYLTMANPFTEKMFQDIYGMYKRSIFKVIDKLADYVYRNQAEKIFYYIFYYTSWVFNDEAMYLDGERFKTEEGEEQLDCFGLTEQERKKWPIPFKERMNHMNIFNVVETCLSKRDIEKIEMVLSIFM